MTRDLQVIHSFRHVSLGRGEAIALTDKADGLFADENELVRSAKVAT